MRRITIAYLNSNKEVVLDSNKSRRLARILENFNKVENFQNRSRSSLNPDISVRQVIHSPLRKGESEVIERISSTRRAVDLNNRTNNNEESMMYSSANMNESQLPSLSQRKLNQQNESYRAYQDNTADFENIKSLKTKAKDNRNSKATSNPQDKILYRNYQNESNLR